jgi:transcriptional repressor NrdR
MVARSSVATYATPRCSSYINVSRPQLVVSGPHVLPRRSTGSPPGWQSPATVWPSTRRRPGKGFVVHCPFCRHPDSRVVDSRTADDGTAIRRRRHCPECDRRFTTVEQVTLAVVKRSGVTEPFSRDKVIAGVRKACQGRGVDEDALARLAQQVEERIRALAAAEVPSNEVGLAILGPLRELDEVAYLRFASVYRGFDSLADFEAEISMLRAERGETVPEPRRRIRN